VIRDPRAVVSSLMKVHFWIKEGGLSGPWWQNGLSDEYLDIWVKEDRNPAVLAALQWKQIIIHARNEVKDMYGKNIAYIEVHYEDFVSKPMATAAKIFHMSKLKVPDNILKYIKDAVRIKNMNYKYKKNLSTKEIRLIESVTRSIANEMGYEF
jgi:hypothetical protein